jgi:NADPH2:quinone reductase
MRAVQVVEFGGPEVLVVGEVPAPVAGAGEVLIDVAVADVLFVDTKIRSGWGGEWFTVSPPYVAGNGVAGTVAGIGAGVDPSWAGRRVVARVGRRGPAGNVPAGGYAERAVAPVDELIEVPAGLGLGEAVAFLHDGTTALSILRHAAVEPGQRVLVNAAGGSMGALLVPLLKAAGAHVTGAARGERKLDLVREWGADLAIDYTLPGWAERVREETGGPHVVLDGTGGAAGRAAFDITRPGGRFLAYGAADGFAPVGPDEAASRGIAFVGILDLGHDEEWTRRDLRRLLDDAAAGRIAPFIGQTFPLDRAAAAHAAIEARETVGKTLLMVGA